MWLLLAVAVQVAAQSMPEYSSVASYKEHTHITCDEDAADGDMSLCDTVMRGFNNFMAELNPAKHALSYDWDTAMRASDQDRVAGTRDQWYVADLHWDTPNSRNQTRRTYMVNDICAYQSADTCLSRGVGVVALTTDYAHGRQCRLAQHSPAAYHLKRGLPRYPCDLPFNFCSEAARRADHVGDTPCGDDDTCSEFEWSFTASDWRQASVGELHADDPL
ncbi:MAG: hypothetical protein MHM6MM_001392 [Cercozoa sp. M6MM]